MPTRKPRKPTKKAAAKLEPPTRATPDFWLVWREDGQSPTHRHGTKDDATQEATRLADKHPGVKFWILTPGDFALAVIRKATLNPIEAPQTLPTDCGKMGVQEFWIEDFSYKKRS